MFGPLGGPEIAIIAVVALILFGTGRLSGVGRDLGTSIKEFRRAMSTSDDDAPETESPVDGVGTGNATTSEGVDETAPRVF